MRLPRSNEKKKKTGSEKGGIRFKGEGKEVPPQTLQRDKETFTSESKVSINSTLHLRKMLPFIKPGGRSI